MGQGADPASRDLGPKSGLEWLPAQPVGEMQARVGHPGREGRVRADAEEQFRAKAPGQQELLAA